MIADKISASSRLRQADFEFGVATSSFQIEGASRVDGKQASIWDEFCRQPGRILDASHGDVACDHYHRYEDDIRLIRELGFEHYRLSLAWPRLITESEPLE